MKRRNVMIRRYFLNIIAIGAMLLPAFGALGDGSRIVVGGDGKDEEGNDIKGWVESPYTFDIKTRGISGSTFAGNGGAVYNIGKLSIEDVTFSENIVTGGSGDYAGLAIGGAIDNQNNIDKIINTIFQDNKAEGGSILVAGGAINNGGEIETIEKTEFSGNSAKTDKGKGAWGGAISNAGLIAALKANFSGNEVKAGKMAYGGGLYNYGTISSIGDDGAEQGNAEQSDAEQGDAEQSANKVVPAKFSENKALVGDDNIGDGAGGGIYNEGGIPNIIAEFNKNEAQLGGGFFNVFKNFGEWQKDNSEEYQKWSDNQDNGQQEYIPEDNGYIETLQGVFDSNRARHKGGGLYNGGRIITLSAGFSSNEARGEVDEKGVVKDGIIPQGGAIYNNGGIGEISPENGITGNFAVMGGGIYNTVKEENDERFIPFEKEEKDEENGDEEEKIDKNNGYIRSIVGVFSGNVAGAKGDGPFGGGAIYNVKDALIEAIDARFQNNVMCDNCSGSGGAIYNTGRIKDIKGQKEIVDGVEFAAFQSNVALNVAGGAIYNKSKPGDFKNGLIDSIVADFKGNAAVKGVGGAISNQGNILHIEGNFEANGASVGGGIGNNGGIADISAEFKGNSAGGMGGGIDNGGYLGQAQNEKGDAVYGDVDLKFTENSGTYGGGMYNGGSVRVIKETESDGKIIKETVNAKLTFEENTVWVEGGGLANNCSIPKFEGAFSANLVRNSTPDVVILGPNGYLGGGMSNQGGIHGVSESHKEYLEKFVRENPAVEEMTAPFADNLVRVITFLRTLDDMDEGHIFTPDGEEVTKEEIESLKGNGSPFKGYGGGLYVGKNYIYLTDGESKPIDDEHYSKLSIEKINSAFDGNHVVVLADVGIGQGGAVYNAGWIDKLGASYGDNGVYVNYDPNELVDESLKNAWLKDKETGEYVTLVGGRGYGGALYNSVDGTIGTIAEQMKEDEEAKEASFEGSIVSVANAGGEAYGGAIYNAGEIDKLIAGFSENRAEVLEGGDKAWGGAIANVYEENMYKSSAMTVLKDVEATFLENVAQIAGGKDAEVLGGAVYNSGEIVKMNASFERNKADALYVPEEEKKEKKNVKSNGGNRAFGGAMYNEGEYGKIQNLQADFSQNQAIGDMAAGGAIYNKDGVINQITGKISDEEEEKRAVFSGNVATVGEQEEGTLGEERSAFGGAIYNGGKIDSVWGEFSENKVEGKANTSVAGGAIYNTGKMTFKDSYIHDNIAQTGTGEKALGGAVYNSGTMTFEGTDFSNNNASSVGSSGQGGAVYNSGTMTFEGTDFSKNNASSDGSSGQGGAVYNSGTITFVNSGFSDNNASGKGSSGQGGAIFNERGEVNIIAQGEDSIFKGNKVNVSNNSNGLNNAIYMKDGTLNLTANKKGSVIFNDNINGYSYDDGKGNYTGNYVLNINGDGSGLVEDKKLGLKVSYEDVGEIYFNTNQVSGYQVKNIKTLNLNENSVLHLGKTTKVQTYDFIGNGGLLKLDMEVKKGSTSVVNGVIDVLNDVTGTTNVVLKYSGALYDGANSIFLKAPNDNLETKSSFNIIAYYGSPYAWVASLNYGGEKEGSTWYMVLDKETGNVSPDGPSGNSGNGDGEGEGNGNGNSGNGEGNGGEGNGGEGNGNGNGDGTGGNGGGNGGEGNGNGNGDGTGGNGGGNGGNGGNGNSGSGEGNGDGTGGNGGGNGGNGGNGNSGSGEGNGGNGGGNGGNTQLDEECIENPDQLRCKIPYCRTHPNAPVCRENYCETHPHISACKDVTYCETHQLDYVCRDDSYCETHPNALVCKDSIYCKTHPNEPACKDIAHCVTHPKEYACLDESADGDGSNYKVYYQPEVPAYVAIQRAAIEQNRHLTRNVALGLESDKNIISAENKYRQTRNFAPEKSIWEHFSHDRATIHAPSEAEASINGFTAGVDLYRDEEKRAGVFGTYTNGDYDFSGKGKYQSRSQSKLGIKSYGGGLYYQKDNKNMSLLTTLFAGKQDIDVSATSSYTSASTKAMQYGASLAMSRRLELTEYFDIEPSLGLSYMMIDIDKFTDNMGKEVDFDVVHYLEAELGLRMELKFRFNGAKSRLYVKPSVIKTFASGAKTRISKMGEIETYENELLGRVEVGGIIGFTPQFSGYTSAGYTFGQDYDAYDVNVGVNYRF